jgi:hypothetical protein
MTYTEQEAIDLYSYLNGEGKGFGVGDDNQDATEALESEGYTIIGYYRDSLWEATKDGATYLVGGDGMGRNAWAVQV